MKNMKHVKHMKSSQKNEHTKWSGTSSSEVAQDAVDVRSDLASGDGIASTSSSGVASTSEVREMLADVTPSDTVVATLEKVEADVVDVAEEKELRTSRQGQGEAPAAQTAGDLSDVVTIELPRRRRIASADLVIEETLRERRARSLRRKIVDGYYQLVGTSIGIDVVSARHGRRPRF